MVTLTEWYHKGEITPERLEAAVADFARDCIARFGAHTAYATAPNPR
jgi:hypothetical protein